MAGSGIDKEEVYGKFQKTADWKDDLHKKLAHKALDIAEDVGITVNKVASGLGWKELAVIGALLLSGWKLWQSERQAVPPPAAPIPAVTAPAPTSPVDSEYEVRFYNDKGEPIEVAPLSSKPK